MPSSIILLQPERTITLPAGTTQVLVQENTLAANILQYQFVVPIIRVVRSSDNNLTTLGVNFTFQTAALLASPDDELAKGTRFFDVAGYTILANGINGKASTAGVV